MQPLPEPTDEALVARVRAGELDAFERLVARYERRIYTLALQWLGSVEDAEDAAQEAFLRAFTSLAGFRGEASFSTWLYRIAVNICRDELRRRRRRVTQSLDAGSDEERPVPQLADPGPDPQTVSETADARFLVEQALAELPSEYREAVVMRDLHELSYEEVAAVLGVAVGTVKSRIHRGRQMLRQRLASLELLPPGGVRPRQQGGAAES